MVDELALDDAAHAGAADLLRDLELPEEGFDTVVCVFGIFFVPGMGDQMRRHRQPLRSPDDWWAIVLGSGQPGRSSVEESPCGRDPGTRVRLRCRGTGQAGSGI